MVKISPDQMSLNLPPPMAPTAPAWVATVVVPPVCPGADPRYSPGPVRITNYDRAAPRPTPLTEPVEKEWITLPEAAVRIGCTRSNVYNISKRLGWEKQVVPHTANPNKTMHVVRAADVAAHVSAEEAKLAAKRTRR